MNKAIAFGAITILAIQGSCKSDQQKLKVQKPNIIYILADDLGIGDLSCYGQKHFSTPNIDRMAQEGMRFTEHYCGTTVCAPSRASLMTGLHTGHTTVRGNKEALPEGQAPIPQSDVTIAEMLKANGYVTGAFGKWGLGFPGSEGDPNNQGFDEFFGYNCQRMAHRYYPPYLWHNQEKYVLEGNDFKNKAVYAQDVIQQKALEFIESNKDKPFYAYIPYIIPHAELIVPEDSVFDSFDGIFTEKPFVGKEGADYGDNLVIWMYCSQPEPKATFASMVTRLDGYVGQVLDKLKELGIAENTIVFFASDNGPHQEGGADPDFFDSNGKYRGYKRDLYDGGIRSPFIAWCPGSIKAGSESDLISAFWDMMPTISELTGSKMLAKSDGLSMAPTLLGEKNQKKHDYLYWEFHEKGGRQAVRKDKWKAVRYNVKENPNGPIELYDISKDPGEEHNIAKDFPAVAAELTKLMDGSRVPSQDYNFGMETLKGND